MLREILMRVKDWCIDDDESGNEVLCLLSYTALSVHLKLFG
jgi:hypothetical protein